MDLIWTLVLGYLGIGLGVALFCSDEYKNIYGFLYHVFFWILELR
jgi:hypothetical protein